VPAELREDEGCKLSRGRNFVVVTSRDDSAICAPFGASLMSSKHGT
jgi:hypothetical protein